MSQCNRNSTSIHWLGAALVASGLSLGCSPSSGPAGSTSAGATNSSAVAPKLVARKLLNDEALAREIDEVIQFTSERQLSAKTNAAWQVVHGILAYGRDLQLIDGTGQPVSAMDYLCAGGALNGWKLEPGDHGVEALVDPGSMTGQGHEDQWLGYFALLGVPIDHPIKVGGQDYQLKDLVTQAQWDIHDGMEATWTLMATSQYLAPGTTWKAKDGSEWSVERIVGMEARQNLAESACGGTHRMVGISTALNQHKAAGGKLTGGWKVADDVVRDCMRRSREFQQPSGALSASYFERPSSSGDIAQQIQTTGHALEFVIVSASDEQLKEAWVQRAVQYLCKVFRLTRDADVECGWLYHATRGLRIYRERRFGTPSETTAADVAQGPTASDPPIQARSASE